MKILLYFLLSIVNIDCYKFPTKRWKYICNNSIKWANNETLFLKKTFISDNNI